MAMAKLDAVIRHLRRVVMRQDGAGWTDGQLLASFLDHKEEAAFEALVRRHGPMVFGVCRRLLHNHHDAEDAFQATLRLPRRPAVLGLIHELVEVVRLATLRRSVSRNNASAKRR